MNTHYYLRIIGHFAKNYFSNGLPMIFQRILAFIAIVLFSPLLIITAIAIALNSRGPVIFRQIRVGEQGYRFPMYKFRSMYLPSDKRHRMPEASDRDGICKTYFSDHRITAVGGVIRKLSIDELPQLFNVLFGDMALIGPRPALPCEVDAYETFMLHRLDVKPGITGLWQVSGRADIGFIEQIQLDFKYINERSFLMDLKILFATVPAVIGGRGAY